MGRTGPWPHTSSRPASNTCGRSRPGRLFPAWGRSYCNAHTSRFREPACCPTGPRLQRVQARCACPRKLLANLDVYGDLGSAPEGVHEEPELTWCGHFGTRRLTGRKRDDRLIFTLYRNASPEAEILGRGDHRPERIGSCHQCQRLLIGSYPRSPTVPTRDL